MRPTVLIVTQEFDPTADPVVRRLAEAGADVVRVDLSYFPRRLSFTASDFGGERLLLRHGDREVDLDALSGVWYRRPTEFVFDERMGDAEREFARNEARHAIGGILRSTRCLWVNRPDLDGVADLKPHHLRIAKRLGLRTPRTLLTNDPAEVARLRKEADGPLVYKALSGGLITYPGGFPTGLLTTVVGDEIDEHLDRVGHTMCTFQEYIDKAYEVRLTVIGNTFFPVAIQSQDREETRIDWRGDQHLSYGEYRPLPEPVVRRVQEFMDELGLVYAALDFVVTPDGEHVFLEVNPAGQFMWMRHDLDLPLDDCLAELLMKGGPFVRGEVTQIGY